MENLDNDVLENILFRLPLGAASSCAKRVCKSWQTILANRPHDEVGFLLACYHDKGDSTEEIQLYFEKEDDNIDGNKMNCYSRETILEMEYCRFSYKSSQGPFLVGSCNGLVCFKIEDYADGSHEPFAICNPLTSEFIFLKADYGEVRDPRLVSSGFGYCKSTDEYKVVRLFYTLKREEHQYGSHFQVYTIGSNEWRNMETTIYYRFRSPGIFANGNLYWLSREESGSDLHIVAFDLEDEKFRELRLPPPEVLQFPEHFRNELKFLGENLCWVKRNNTQIDIWAYKRKKMYTDNTRYDTEERDQKRYYYNKKTWNWVKEFSINCGRYFEPVGITKSNQVLLLDSKNFYSYDPKARNISKLGDDKGIECSYIQAIPHLHSYVSLKDYGETWYGLGHCSEVPQTNSYVSSTEVKNAYRYRKRNLQL